MSRTLSVVSYSIWDQLSSLQKRTSIFKCGGPVPPFSIFEMIFSGIGRSKSTLALRSNFKRLPRVPGASTQSSSHSLNMYYVLGMALRTGIQKGKCQKAPQTRMYIIRKEVYTLGFISFPFRSYNGKYRRGLKLAGHFQAWGLSLLSCLDSFKHHSKCQTTFSH